MNLAFEQKLALIKEYKEDNKVTDRRLGELSGVHHTQIGRYLKQESMPTTKNKMKMEYLFELLVDMGKIRLDEESYTEFLEKETEGLYEELKELQSLSREMSLQTVDNDSNINSLFQLIREHRGEIEGLQENIEEQKKLNRVLLIIQFVIAVLIAMKL